MIEQVVASITEAERKAEDLILVAREEARAVGLSASGEAEEIQSNAEDEAQAIRRKYRELGDASGREKAATLLQTRREEFSHKVQAANMQIDDAVAFILERIGTHGD